MGSPSLSKAFRGGKKEDKIQSVAEASSLPFHLENGELSFREVSHRDDTNPCF